MIIKLVLPDGASKDIKFSHSTRVSDLKVTAQVIFDIKFNIQRLTYNDRVLRDEEVLGDVVTGNTATFHLSLNLRRKKKSGGRH